MAQQQSTSSDPLAYALRLVKECLSSGEGQGQTTALQQALSKIPDQVQIQQLINMLKPQDPHPTDVTYPPHIDAPIVPAPPPPTPAVVPSTVTTEDVQIQIQDIPIIATKNILAQKHIPSSHIEEFTAQYGQGILNMVENVSVRKLCRRKS